MLTVKEKGLLLYIVDHCNRIEEKTKRVSEEQFFNNEGIKEIVCFNAFQQEVPHFNEISGGSMSHVF